MLSAKISQFNKVINASGSGPNFNVAFATPKPEGRFRLIRKLGPGRAQGRAIRQVNRLFRVAKYQIRQKSVRLGAFGGMESNEIYHPV